MTQINEERRKSKEKKEQARQEKETKAFGEASYEETYQRQDIEADIIKKMLTEERQQDGTDKIL